MLPLYKDGIVARFKLFSAGLLPLYKDGIVAGFKFFSAGLLPLYKDGIEARFKLFSARTALSFVCWILVPAVIRIERKIKFLNLFFYHS